MYHKRGGVKKVLSILYILAASTAGNSTFPLIFGFVVLVICVGIAIFKLGRSRAASTLGLRVSVEPARVSLGRQMKVIMNVKPKIPVEVTRIQVSLECQRFRKSHHHHHGHHGSHDHHVVMDKIAKAQSSIPVGEVFPAGESQTMTADLIVPSDGLPTGHPGELRVQWFLTVIFEIPETFDAEKKMEINVYKH